MKYIITLFCLLAHITYAQQPATAKIQEPSGKYTSKTLEANVVALIDEEVIKNLPDASTTYFSVSVIFVTDVNGVVIKEFTQIKTHSEVLNKRIEEYINSLPAYIPSDISNNDDDEKRKPHFINFTMLRDNASQKFYAVENNELKERNIEPLYLNPDEASLFPGCERTGNYEQDFECTKKMVHKYLMKNTRVPETNKTGRVKIFINFHIGTKGEISIENISGALTEYLMAVRKAINRMPKLTPNYKNGIPMRTAFNTSMTIDTK